jgi:hypothetical protein
MATAAKLAILDEESQSVAELLGSFTGAEMLAASKEISRVYDGIVLAVALRIVQQRTGKTPIEISRQIGIPRSSLHRWRTGLPRNHRSYECAIRDLAILLLEEGVSPRRAIC